MGTFVTQEDTPTLFEAGTKQAAPNGRLPDGWTNRNVAQAADLNALHDALFDVRTEIRSHIPNLKQFGAVGDGVADDTAALNRAGAAGRVVAVPPGIYRCTSRVSLTEGTVFTAQDATRSILRFEAPGLEASPYQAVALGGVGAGLERLSVQVVSGDYRRTVDMRASKTFVRGCIIEVTTADVGDAAPHYIIFASQGADNPLYDLVIEENDVTASGVYVGDGVQANCTPGIKVLRNRFHDIQSVGSDHHNWAVYISQQANHCLVAFNQILNCEGIGGIHFNDDPSLGGTGDADYGRRIIGNTIESVTYVGISVDYVVGGVVQGNFVRDAAIGVKVIDGEDNLVLGNHVRETHSSTLSSEHPFIETDSNAARVLIANNTLGARGDAVVGINAYGPDGLVQGNRFNDDPPATGIIVGASATRAIVSGNFLPVQSASTTYAIGIFSNDALIAGNWVEFPAAPGYGIRIAGNNSLVTGNRISGAGNNGVFIASGTGNTVRGNLFTSALLPISDSGTGSVKRDNVWNGKPTQASGRSTQSGDGSKTAFTIAHGIGTTPASMVVTPGSSAAAAAFHVTADATNITVTFAAAPASGTNNVILNWLAEV